jgi:hypothetical protein
VLIYQPSLCDIGPTIKRGRVGAESYLFFTRSKNQICFLSMNYLVENCRAIFYIVCIFQFNIIFYKNLSTYPTEI